jgi:Zn-dependent protease
LANIDFGNLIIWFIALLFSLSFHEAGRITLNPVAHIDPFGTILFPIISALSGIPLLGWAKPVQTNPLLWRDKTKANICVSAAGPISNFILAAVTFIVIKSLLTFGVLQLRGGYYTLVQPPLLAEQAAFLAPLSVFLSVMLLLNIGLGVFNLIPVPPLDGSHVLEELLPASMSEAYAQIQPYGFLLLYGLMFLGVFGAIFVPVYNFVIMMLQM